MEKETKKEWFESWFNSPYYHLLYQNRDENEAAIFIHNLLTFLNFKTNSSLLDLACGKGRHALILNQNNFNVFGADLSENSIIEAKKQENESLHFFVHDMRNKLPINNLDGVFNLFTSFGYFENQTENVNVLISIWNALKSKGLLIIDFMNTHKMVKNLNPFEDKTCGDVNFTISRWEDGKHIYKKIEFETELNKETHIEKVQQLYKSDFENLLRQTGFIVKNVFGSYQLENFVEDKSDRLIIIAQKDA